MVTEVGSSRIQAGFKPDPSPEIGRGEEKNLKEWRLEFLEIQETRTRLVQEREEAKITQAFLRKIKSHEDGKSEGEDLQLGNKPKLRDEWDRMYEWIPVLMEYIGGMVCWKFRDLKSRS